MARVVVIAYRAPGDGIATYEDGRLSGDPVICEYARPVIEDMEWSNAFAAAQALREGAQIAYGEPIEVLMPIDSERAVPHSALREGQAGPHG